jgi:hypothetical protein
MYEFLHSDGPMPEFGRSCAACLAAIWGLSLHRLALGMALAAVNAASMRAASSGLSPRSEQRGTLHTDGSYTLELPYADDRELIGDILRHGSEVEVILPKGLVKNIKVQLARASKLYPSKRAA